MVEDIHYISRARALGILGCSLTTLVNYVGSGALTQFGGGGGGKPTRYDESQVKALKAQLDAKKVAPTRRDAEAKG